MYGEPVAVLLPALLKLHAGMEKVDGSFWMQAILQPEEGEALWRGLMRAESALLRKDADAFPRVDRSHGERQSAALVALAVGVVDAAQRLGLPSPSGAAPCSPGVTLGYADQPAPPRRDGD